VYCGIESRKSGINYRLLKENTSKGIVKTKARPGEYFGWTHSPEILDGLIFDRM